MKKVASIILVLLFVFGAVGCGEMSSKDYLKQGKEQLQNKQYEKALESFSSALDKDNKNEEANLLSEIIQGYLNGKKYLKEENLDKAKEALENINKEYEKHAIKEDIDSLKTEVDKQLSQNQEVNERKQAKVENKDKNVNTEPEKTTQTQPTNKDKNAENTEKNNKTVNNEKDTSNQTNKNAKETNKKTFTIDEAIKIAKNKYGSNSDLLYSIVKQGAEDGKKYYEIIIKSKSIMKNGGNGTVDLIKVFENGTIKTR